MPHALQRGRPRVLEATEVRPKTQPEALNLNMQCFFMNFTTRVKVCKRDWSAHSTVNDAFKLLACSASLVQRLHIRVWTIQCPIIFRRVMSVPFFQLGPSTLLYQQPAVHGDEFQR